MEQLIMKIIQIHFMNSPCTIFFDTISGQRSKYSTYCEHNGETKDTYKQIDDDCHATMSMWTNMIDLIRASE
jgi:hypothetical protein